MHEHLQGCYYLSNFQFEKKKLNLQDMATIHGENPDAKYKL